MRGTATGLGLGGKWFMTDHQNSVISVYDPSRNSTTSGAFAGDALYEPHGVTTNSADTNLGFVGGHEVATDIYQIGRRFYDSATAQWTQADPLEQQTDLKQANRYAYAGANGVNYTDPMGTSLLGDAWGAAKKAGGFLNRNKYKFASTMGDLGTASAAYLAGAGGTAACFTGATAGGPVGWTLGYAGCGTFAVGTAAIGTYSMYSAYKTARTIK